MTDCWLCSHGKCGGNGGPQADCLGEQGLMNDDRLLITDGVHTENTEENGGPQADCFGERQLENNKYPQMSQMDTDLEPVARIIND